MKNGFFTTLTLCALVSVLAAPASRAADRPFHLSYAGTGHYTAVDPNQDGVPADFANGAVHGTFGNGIFMIASEFIISPHECPAGYDIPMIFVKVSTIMTFSDRDQLFGGSTDGSMCISSTTGHYFGEVSGVYFGGTGRFEGATGEWTTHFDGVNQPDVFVDPVLGFRSFQGVIDGTLSVN